MVVDAALWVILATAITFVCFGCRMTRPLPAAAEETFEERIDRAA
jgi:uncharacterized membrane protein YccC